MGTVRDWNKVFDGVDYLEFECVVSFLPELSLERKEAEVDFLRNKRTIFEEGVHPLYEEEIGARHAFEKTLFDEGKFGFSEEMRRISAETQEYEKALGASFVEDFYEKIRSDQEAFWEEIFYQRDALGQEEEMISSFLSDERDVYKEGEKIFFGYGTQREKRKVLSEERRREVIRSAREVSGENGRMQIEMKKRSRFESEEDMERITDMLTLRLCDMMQKSAEGYYV